MEVQPVLALVRATKSFLMILSASTERSEVASIMSPLQNRAQQQAALKLPISRFHIARVS